MHKIIRITEIRRLLNETSKRLQVDKIMDEWSFKSKFQNNKQTTII